jgi:hypothetical protein
LNPATSQLITTIVGALIIAAILGLAKLVTGKADKSEVKRVEDESRKAVDKLEVDLAAALLVVAQAITRPELTEKLLNMTGRADDARQRIIADIVSLSTDVKANTKANVETDKRLDDLPGRVRSLEENQKRS